MSHRNRANANASSCPIAYKQSDPSPTKCTYTHGGFVTRLIDLNHSAPTADISHRVHQPDSSSKHHYDHDGANNYVNTHYHHNYHYHNYNHHNNYYTCAANDRTGHGGDFCDHFFSVHSTCYLSKHFQHGADTCTVDHHDDRSAGAIFNNHDDSGAGSARIRCSSNTSSTIDNRSTDRDADYYDDRLDHLIGYDTCNPFDGDALISIDDAGAQF